jgi:hypothetical protein
MTEWASQRARFNHDRLKNQFIQSVARLIRALEGRTLDQEFVDEFLSRLSAAWSELETEALDLLDRAESETGPSAWFRYYPLNRLSNDDRLWMEALLTRKWRAHSDPRATVSRARDLLADVREHCRKLASISYDSRTARFPQKEANKCHQADVGNGELLGSAVALHGAGQRLSEVFHQLSSGDPIQFLARTDRLKCV